ncbi:hypothetical protein E3U55_14655 [Filobacillus milosensis]|uniref:Copper resistance protein D domain-containing protein n=1 Tax=Filobacillus milosensis TaxID=94137 RepID=A0A4Y8IE03_9BACI|nr:hypothetical protein [Filobacillus milosensis]TFB14150.1 hypothetical protein E3U55_14655 [Filobacillus milosensis]
MLKIALTLVSIPLIITHLFILYFWIFDWRQLVTDVGLIVWVGSIKFGILLYLVFRIYIKTEKITILNQKLIFATTFLTILLAFFALIIEFITSSMP